MKLSLELWWIPVLLVVLAALLYGWIQERQSRALRQTGRPAVATVISARQTGGWVANNPVMEIALEVRVQQHASYSIVVKEVIPVIAAGNFTPGATVHVRIDSVNPQKLAFDEPWAREE
jgi:hypothetical protein